MDITPLINRKSKVIQSYGGGQFKVSGEVFKRAILVSAEKVIPWDGVVEFSALKQIDFDVIKEAFPDAEIVLLGVGGEMRFLPMNLRHHAEKIGLSVDPMDTGAACRTYNVLLAEGRQVVAALFPV